MAARTPSRRHRAAGLVLAFLASIAVACTQFKRCSYEGWGRDEWQEPERVVAALELEPGARVADLGSGGGYFTFRLARAVGPAGRVYAVDVDEGLNAYVAGRAREEGLANVEVILAEYADPKLPEPVDLVFTSNTYHHIEDRPRYFENAKKYLRPNGRVAILEYSEAPSWFLPSHTTSAEAIRSEMEAAGYRLLRKHDFPSKQHFLVFGME
jgi:cyclopropane fatty-acyl-phospholipid synthase-like methyltransferase